MNHPRWARFVNQTANEITSSVPDYNTLSDLLYIQIGAQLGFGYRSLKDALNQPEEPWPESE